MPKKARHQIIEKILNRNNLTDFSIIKKNEVFNYLKSDFDVVQVFNYSSLFI
jgi:hypothetical protein